MQNNVFLFRYLILKKTAQLIRADHVDQYIPNIEPILFINIIYHFFALTY